MRPTTAVSRPDLGSVAYEHIMESKNFIGGQILPVFEVPTDIGEYPVIPLESILKSVDNVQRAARAAYARADWEWTPQPFACKEYGFEEVIDDKEAAMYRRFFDLEVVSTEIATGVLMRDREKRVQALIGASANTSAGSDWGTPATATPKADIVTASEAMRTTKGVRPNAIAMSQGLFSELTNTVEIRDYLQYTSPHLMQGEEAQRDTIARYFGLNQVLVGDVQEDTAKRGKAATLGELWPLDEAYLLRVSTGGQNLKEPSAGRSFLFTGDAPDELVVEMYREDNKRSDVVRVRTNMDEHVQYAGAIYRVTGL